MANLLIAGGMVIDGTGAKARRADVRIAGDRIAAVGRLSRESGDTVLDASGLVVSPGFIDTHSHADGGLLEMPTADTHIRQGITTSVVGQDGGHNYPLADWLAKVEQTHVALNIASFVGHGTARSKVLGDDFKRPATPDEVRRMRALVAAEMQAGGLGLSSGLEYDPGHYATTEELIALAQVAGVYGGLYISHVRDEENGSFDSLRELIRIAREGRLPAQVSHVKLASAPVWGKVGEYLRMMADARRAGLDITADVYSYTYWQSTLAVLVLSRNYSDRGEWTKGFAEIGGPQNVLLSDYTPDPTWAGKTLAQLATTTGKDAITLAQEILANTQGGKGRQSVVVTAMREEDVRRFIADPEIMFCTDGGLKPSHPRGAGAFPRVFAHYVRKLRALPLEAAVHKATALPAKRMGFADRGILVPGKRADLTLFDPKRIRDTATVKEPASPPEGLPHVIVNGISVVRDGKVTGERPGMVLRRRSA